jgi:hypothetical protein
MPVTMTMRRDASGERVVVILNDGQEVGSILFRDFTELAIVKMAKCTPTEEMSRSMADAEAGLNGLMGPHWRLTPPAPKATSPAQSR